MGIGGIDRNAGTRTGLAQFAQPPEIGTRPLLVLGERRDGLGARGAPDGHSSACTIDFDSAKIQAIARARASGSSGSSSVTGTCW